MKTGHPLSFVASSIKKFNLENATFYFDKYFFEPGHGYNPEYRGITESLSLKGSEITPDRIDDIIYELEDTPVENLLFKSKFNLDGKYWHLPLIDCEFFVDAIADRPVFQKLANHLSQYTSQLAVFSSGRSYHVYLSDIIPEDKFIQYMTDLLLFSTPKQVPPIDHRWVAHQIRQGEMGLRWSKNGAYYLKVPEFLFTLAGKK